MVLKDASGPRGAVVKVLVTRYGLEWGRLRAGERMGSESWREIMRIRDEVSGLRDDWFGESATRKVRDGT
jgi:hypothetical protein